ncbi:hypothetical protein LTR56_016106 [Elasticomyces elasticus]|nr:hypothetical protein LTR56_016106 [Elasticomyces elasticus]KAK3653839.1 hypothetical protein LTR22_011054 [Elasticomyces elasticus]KAK4916041.1 hypothetical protein LTR49_015952 [Elasticomyces elasticus]KAK5755423.1 hypothetical protein LTS12_014530 [Elasticomyces elasticus]
MSKAATATVKQTTVKPHELMRFVYTAHPTPLNCTTLPSTRDFAADPSHPFHLRTVRRLEAFDAKKLHWRIQCPVDISCKGFVRNWVVKRFKSAVVKKLGVTGGEGNGLGLTGALLIILAKEKGLALTATKTEVETSVGWVLDEARKLQKKSKGRDGGKRPVDLQREDGKPLVRGRNESLKGAARSALGG